jgi:integrase
VKKLIGVKLKGNRRKNYYIRKDAREALDEYLARRGDHPGSLFLSKTGGKLSRQDVWDTLKRIENQANSTLSEDEKMHLWPHKLRHTCLQEIANDPKNGGVHLAMEVAGHASARYIWRYVKNKEEALEEKLEKIAQESTVVFRKT